MQKSSQQLQGWTRVPNWIQLWEIATAHSRFNTGVRFSVLEQTAGTALHISDQHRLCDVRHRRHTNFWRPSNLFCLGSTPTYLSSASNFGGS
jgi:hypothetical protein